MDNIPSNLLRLDQNFENIELELPAKTKWLISYSYNPHKRNTKRHVSNISKGLNELNSKYDNILICDLNSEMSELSLDEFCQTFSLESIVSKPIYFKNPKNPSCIDPVLTNKQERLKAKRLKAKTFESGLSYINKMVVSDFKTSFKKEKPK